MVKYAFKKHEYCYFYFSQIQFSAYYSWTMIKQIWFNPVWVQAFYTQAFYTQTYRPETRWQLSLYVIYRKVI